MEERSKILTFIGFSIKSGKLRAGVNAIESVRNPIYCMIICSTASDNTFKDAISLARKFRTKLILSKTFKIEDIISKDNCKLIAILDKNLAHAILDNLDNNFLDYFGDDK